MINYSGKNDFKPQQSVSFDALPAGAYIGKVLGAKIEDVDYNGVPGQRLAIQLDVTEGEYTDHFQKMFKAQQAAGGNFAPKYKGILRLNIPRSGDQYEAGNRRALENAAWALEQSNNGYHWDWDETKLKGLNVGFSVRERDWIMEQNGDIQSGTTTEIARLESVSAVREGRVKPMRKKELSEANKAKLAAHRANTSAGYTDVTEDEELPF